MSVRFSALLTALLLAAACSSNSTAKQESGNSKAIESNNPIVRARLQSRIDNIKYQRGAQLIANLERIAAYGEMAVPACVRGLESEDPMTRMGCSYALGRIGDTKVIPQLTKVLDDDVAYVRYEAASRLGDLGSRAGYRVLVEGLGSDRIEYRFKCYEALNSLTGQSFGYQHNAAPEARQVSVAQWQSWLDRVESEEL